MAQTDVTNVTSGDDVLGRPIKEYPNSTETTPSDGRGIFNKSVYEQQFWIECETILVLLTIFASYVFVCIVRYVVTKKSIPSRDSSGKQGKRLYIMLVLASGFSVLRLASDHVVAFTSSNSDDHCIITIAVSTVLYAFGLMSVYIFLWLRQSIFYGNPVLKKVLNKAVTAVSWSTLAVMILSGVCLTVLYNVPAVNGWAYQVTEDGCKGVLVGDEEIVATVTLATTVYFQITLLALFLYPLLSRKTRKFRSAGNQSAAEDGSTRRRVSSISNTDDNLTDGGGSSSYSQPKLAKDSHRVEYPTLSENESGIDVDSSGKFSESPTNDTKNAANNSKNTSNKACADGGTQKDFSTEKTRLKEHKRPSVFNTPRFFKGGSIFYRRNQKQKEHIESNPKGKETKRDKDMSFDSQNVEKKHRTWSAGSQKKNEIKKHKRSKKTHQGRRMMAYLRKSLYMMLICVVTDITCTVIQARINVPEIVYLVTFDLNLIINVICIVMSFRDWDVILLPLCARTSKKSGGNTKNNSNGSVTKLNPEAAKRRAEVLRSARPSAIKSPTVTSPNACSAFSYDVLAQDRLAEASTPEKFTVQKELDLRNKT